MLVAVLAFQSYGYTLPASWAPPAAHVAGRASFLTMADGSPLRVGVLAIQGGFAEHIEAIKRQSGVEAIEVCECIASCLLLIHSTLPTPRAHLHARLR